MQAAKLITMSSIFIASFVNEHVTYAQSNPYLGETMAIPIINTFNFESIEFQNTPENCTEAFEAFTENVTNLVRCTLLNARPILFCTRCGDVDLTTKAAYQKLQEEASCRGFYLESDHIGLINLVYKQGRDLWSQNNCQNCYDNINDTLEFFSLAKEFDVCMKNFNKTLTGRLGTVCDVCQNLFAKMNDIYKEFVMKISIGESAGVCMDIVDQMNITRHIWSGQNCFRFDSDVGYSNIITAVLVAIIPLLFYLLSKNVSIIEDVKLVRPKRKSYASLQDVVPNNEST